MPRFAPVADIRTAYRKLVLTCHPDKVQDLTQKAQKLEEFQKLQHAYELLTDEKERVKYDEQVKLMELRKEMSRNMANTSAPRTPRTYNVSIRTAEPRSSPYAQSPPQAGSRLYAQYSHSPKEEYINVDDTGTGRSAKRTQTYDKRSSRKDKELDEDREREKAQRRRREKEEDREELRDRERRSSDKESRKAEKKRQDKERKHAHEEKAQHTSSAYVEEYSGDGDAPKSEKKKSSSRKHRDRESTPRVEVLADRTTTRLSAAESYIASRGGPVRANTFDDSMTRSSPPSVPTPPPPRDSAYTKPPAPAVSDDDDEEEEPVHRSRAPVRRGSYDPPRSKDRAFMHKRSFPSGVDEPAHLSTSPGYIATMAAGSPKPSSLQRPSTFHHAAPRSGFGPPIRAHTYAGEADPRDPRGRARSRHQAQMTADIDEEEDEDEQRQQVRRQRSSRREGRESATTDPIRIPGTKSSSYMGEGRSLGRDRDSYGRSSKTYLGGSSGSSGYAAVEPGYSQPRGAQYGRVKTTKLYGE
ncbi:J domain-containing protein, partial [Candidatus Bathyarchaeota archaeon]|nr:J domain-containing protein [Candidatus Bathyarchaeota archaeon]